MSASEVGWRARSGLRDVVDGVLVSRRQRPLPLRKLVHEDGAGLGSGSIRLCDLEVGQWASARPGTKSGEWRAELLRRADAIAAHRLSLFDLEDRHLGTPIDWNRDHKTGRPAPLRFSAGIDYRDPDVTGDCKFVWEPNRHHHLVVLARAYRATGDTRYARAIAAQVDSWLDACPYGIGMNWRSPLELGIRLINWAWTVDMIRESMAIDRGLQWRLMQSVYRHVWDISRKYARKSSVNNHLIGEAAGVFVATSCFPALHNAQRWQAESWQILCEQILAQTFADGGSREQALGYQLFVAQLFLVSGLVARTCGREFPRAYWSRLEKMFEFVGVLSEGGQNLPFFGDCDDGYVLDLGRNGRDHREWMSAAAVLYGRPDFKAWSGEYSETARWLLGSASEAAYCSIPDAQGEELTSRCLPDSGYYLLQWGRRGSHDRVSVVFDCGPLGMGPLAAHGHADALSFTLRAFGQDVLVDPGTYDYFSHPRWRTYFRSTRAHNTVVIDGQDQSVMEGPFLWGQKATAQCVSWQPQPGGGTVCGEHDGYARLHDPVTHRRVLELDRTKRCLVVRDRLLAAAQHEADVFFHAAESCRVLRVNRSRFRIDTSCGFVVLELDSRLAVRVVEGSEDPIGGWVSRGYHRKLPSVTLIGHSTFENDLTLTHRILIGQPHSSP